MTGRHELCEVCGKGRLQVVVLNGERITSCSNRDCPTHTPTGPITDQHRQAARIEVEHIKRDLRERLRSDDTGGWHRR